LGWKFDAESPGSSLVEGQLELDRCLYRKISRLRALEDAIHIRCRPTHEIDRVTDVLVSWDFSRFAKLRQLLTPSS
jgi:hypothetical protein